MVVDDLLQFGVVGCVAFIVNPSGVESRAPHLPSSPSDQNHLNLRNRILLFNIPLNQWNAPVLFYSLVYEILAHCVVPHVPSVNIPEFSIGRDLF